MRAEPLRILLWVSNLLLALALATVGLAWTVEVWMGPAPAALVRAEEIPLPKPQAQPQPDLSAFRVCWEAKILEERPVEPVKPPKKPEPAAMPPVQAATAPFTLVAAAGHTDPQRSYAILLDGGRQVLVRQGCVIGKTSWRVVGIERDRVRLAQGSATATLERKRNVLPNQPATSPSLQMFLSGVQESDQRLTVTQSASLAALGFEAQDQIVAVGGKRVYDLAGLRQNLEESAVALTEVSVLRQGRLVSLHISAK